ncbi:MAG: YfhO family protein [Deltaproteobacteria bacterium]|nr:YfhO family protein [Deltaproteobacteria bacterium]
MLKQNIRVTLLLLILLVVFFYKGLITQDITLIWDAADYNYPSLAFNAHYIKNGIFPLWNPLFFSGFPIFADTLTGMFYPFTILLSLFCDLTPFTIYIFEVFHFLIAGLSMYLLCHHHLKLNSLASLVGGISFMLMGYQLGHFEHFYFVVTAAWFPLLFLLFDKAMRDNSVKYALAGAFVLALHILGGHPQTYYYSCFMLGIHWIYKVASSITKGRVGPWVWSKIIPWKVSSAPFGSHSCTVPAHAGLAALCKLGIVFFVLGVTLAAIQLVPTLELIQHSNRQEVQDLFSSGHGLNLRHLITMLIPNYFGGVTTPYWDKGIDISQQNLYMGVLTIILAGWGVLGELKKRKFMRRIFKVDRARVHSSQNEGIQPRPPRGFPSGHQSQVSNLYLIFMAALSLCISLGNVTPLYSVLYHYVPGFASFRDIMQFAFVFHFFVALLAAQGLHDLCINGQKTKTLLVYMTALTALVLVCLSFLPKAPQPQYAQLTSTAGMLHLIILAAISFILILLLGHNRFKNSKWPGIVTVIFIFLDLFLLNHNNVTVGRSFANNQESAHRALEKAVGILPALLTLDGRKTDTVIYNQEQTDLRWAFPNKDIYRINVGKGREHFGIVPHGAIGYNRFMLYGVFSPFGYIPTRIKRYEGLLNFLDKKNPQRILDLFNVKYHAQINEELTRYQITKNPDAIERVALIENSIVMNTDEEIINKLADPLFDLHKTVILEKNPTPAPVQNSGNTGLVAANGAHITSYLPNSVKIQTVTDKAGHLLFNDLYYPGWKAFIDDKETEVYRANYVLKAIVLPPGAHEVRFVFAPFSLVLGGVLSLITCMAMLALWVVTRRSRRDLKNSTAH